MLLYLIVWILEGENCIEEVGKCEEGPPEASWRTWSGTVVGCSQGPADWN